VDLASCVNELFGVNKLTGRGNLNFALEAKGASPFALAQSLDGTATLTGNNGAIAGLNIEQLLKRLERRPLSGAGNFQRLDAFRFTEHRNPVQRWRCDGGRCADRRPHDTRAADRNGVRAGARI
jgi:hypothetical protein